MAFVGNWLAALGSLLIQKMINQKQDDIVVMNPKWVICDLRLQRASNYLPALWDDALKSVDDGGLILWSIIQKCDA